MPYLLRLPQHLVGRACSGSTHRVRVRVLHSKREGRTYYCLVLLHTVCEVRNMVIDIYEFRDGAPTADGVLLLDELAMMLYDAMDFTSETGSLQGLSTADRRQLPCGGEACVVD